MSEIKIPTEAEVAELCVAAGPIARGLAFERDQLRAELAMATDAADKGDRARNEIQAVIDERDHLRDELASQGQELVKTKLAYQELRADARNNAHYREEAFTRLKKIERIEKVVDYWRGYAKHNAVEVEKYKAYFLAAEFENLPKLDELDTEAMGKLGTIVAGRSKAILAERDQLRTEVNGWKDNYVLKGEVQAIAEDASLLASKLTAAHCADKVEGLAHSPECTDNWSLTRTMAFHTAAKMIRKDYGLC